MQRKFLHAALIVPMAFATGLTSVACSEGTLEEAGEDADEAIDDAKDAVEEVGDEVEDAVDDAVDEVEKGG